MPLDLTTVTSVEMRLAMSHAIIFVQYSRVCLSVCGCLSACLLMRIWMSAFLPAK